MSFPTDNNWGTVAYNTALSYTRQVAGTAGFSASTSPTQAEVYAFLDDAYFEIGALLEGNGLSIAQTNATVRGFLQSLQGITVAVAIELTNPTNTLSDEGNDRFKALAAARDRLEALITSGALANLGAASGITPRSALIAATGISRAHKQTIYEDPDVVQARFKRGFGEDPRLGGDGVAIDSEVP